MRRVASSSLYWSSIFFPAITQVLMPGPDHLLPLTTDHFTAIGRVAMEWSVIEGYIAFLVRVLVDNNKRIGMTMTVNLQSPAHCDLLKALIYERLGDTPDVKRFRKFIDHINIDKEDGRRSPRTRRNTIIHGSWVSAGDPPTTYAVTHKARGRLKSKSMAYSIVNINAFADEIGDLTGKLIDLSTPLLARVRKSLHWS
jgi:hypothetical protein